MLLRLPSPRNTSDRADEHRASRLATLIRDFSVFVAGAVAVAFCPLMVFIIAVASACTRHRW